MRGEGKGPFYPLAVDVEMTIFIQFELFLKMKLNFSDESVEIFPRTIFQRTFDLGTVLPGTFYPGIFFSRRPVFQETIFPEPFFWGFFSAYHRSVVYCTSDLKLLKNFFDYKSTNSEL